MIEPPAPLIQEPPQTATACVIWLHGLGASGHDFASVPRQLNPLYTQHTRFVFPHAPERPVAINNNMVMPAWYDIPAMDLNQQQDVEGMRDSARRLNAWIEQQTQQGIDSERIVLAGFSQGGAVVLHTGLRYPKPLAGIMALSTYLPLADTVDHERHVVNQVVPILMAHGTDDPVIPLSRGQKSCTALEDLGYAVEFHEYPMQHAVSMEEITEIDSWLLRLLE